jgi:hypothetical protein
MALCFGLVILDLWGRLKIAEVQVNGLVKITDRLIDIIERMQRDTWTVVGEIIDEVKSLGADVSEVKKPKKHT